MNKYKTFQMNFLQFCLDFLPKLPSQRHLDIFKLMFYDLRILACA